MGDTDRDPENKLVTNFSNFSNFGEVGQNFFLSPYPYLYKKQKPKYKYYRDTDRGQIN